MTVAGGTWTIEECGDRDPSGARVGALLASLFALGVMSIAWMAFVAGLIAFEKLVPWRRAATYGTALILLVLGLLLLFAPDALPGVTIPG